MTPTQSQPHTAAYNASHIGDEAETPNPISLGTTSTPLEKYEANDEWANFKTSALQSANQSSVGGTGLLLIQRPLPPAPLLPSSRNPAPPLCPISIPSPKMASSANTSPSLVAKRTLPVSTNSDDAISAVRPAVSMEEPQFSISHETHGEVVLEKFSAPESRHDNKLLDLASIALSELPNYSQLSSPKAYRPMPPPPNFPFR